MYTKYIQLTSLAFSLTFLVMMGCSKKENNEITPSSTTQDQIKVSFAQKIRPLVEQNCSPCHTSSEDDFNFTVYAHAKRKVDKILDRVNRAEGESGFMPKGGKKLSAEKIELIQAWKDSGLAE